MALVEVSKRERAILERLSAQADDARVVRRAEAILWLDEGETPAEVADRLRISVQTVYNWINRFVERSSVPMIDRVCDAARSGRPPSALGIIDPLIAEVIDRTPEDFGYMATVWTAPLLQRYLLRAHEIAVCRGSVSLAIERLRMCWKRPRHDLSRRAEHWRQSKGGSSAA